MSPSLVILEEGSRGGDTDSPSFPVGFCTSVKGWNILFQIEEIF